VRCLFGELRTLLFIEEIKMHIENERGVIINLDVCSCVVFDEGQEEEKCGPGVYALCSGKFINILTEAFMAESEQTEIGFFRKKYSFQAALEETRVIIERLRFAKNAPSVIRFVDIIRELHKKYPNWGVVKKIVGTAWV